ADREENHVAAFFGFADLPKLRARWGRLRDRLEIAMNVSRMIQDSRRADDMSEELERRRNRARRRKVIDQLGRDARIGQVLLDLRRVLLVDLLRGLRECGGGLRQYAGGENRRTPSAHRSGRTRHPSSLF